MRTKEEILQGDSESLFLIKAGLDFNLFCERVLGLQMKDYHKEWGRILMAHNRIVIAAPTGFGKCLGKGTKVIMFDGTMRNVEDLSPGDILMGEDSTPRVIKSTIKGFDELYKVKQKNGKDYIVNEDHILSLRMGANGSFEKKNTIVDISIKDYLKRTPNFKHLAKGFKVGIDFPNKEVPIDPYWLGLWLGDGHSKSQTISKPDIEIARYVKQYADELGLNYSYYKSGLYCPRHSITGISGKPNILLNNLRKLNLIKNKHIPHIYKANSKEVRMKLLAGIVDTDGYTNKGCIDIVQKSSQLSQDIVFLARSLGFMVSINQVTKGIKSRGFVGKYFRIIISGITNEIPCLIPRKISAMRKINKNPLNTGIVVESIGKGDYYGFEILGDKKRFILEDFTVTHNTQIFGIAYPLWLSYFNPSSQSLIISKVIRGQSANILEQIKFQIENNEFLCELKPGSGDLTRSWTKESVVTTNNSKIAYASYSPSVRGGHVDYVFGDEVAVYPDRDENYLIWFRDVSSRVVNKNGKLVAVSTPVDTGDLLSVLLNRPGYFSKSYPAIVNYKIGQYETGESIWPEKYPIQKLMDERREQGIANFERNYMVNPKAEVENAIFKSKMLLDSMDYQRGFTTNLEDEEDLVFLGADFALADGPQSDFDAYVVIEKIKGGKMIIKHMETWKGIAFEQKKRRIKQLIEIYKPYQTICDQSNVGQAVIDDLLENGLNAMGYAFGPKSRNSLLTTAKGILDAGKVIIPANFKEDPENRLLVDTLIEQLLGFKEEKSKKTGMANIASHANHDDIAIALCLALKGSADVDVDADYLASGN